MTVFEQCLQQHSAGTLGTGLTRLWCNVVAWTLHVRNYVQDAVEHLLLALLVYVAICALLYVAIVRYRAFGIGRDIRSARRVLFVIAHPDDECMFFGPTVLNFTARQECIVYLMCLSTGKNYGMDRIRKRELYASCKQLGVDESRIFVHNHSLMPDDIHIRWPTEVVSNKIGIVLESYDIDTVITFDKNGVSGHLNHCSIYYAVAQMALDRKLPRNCKVFVLETVNILRKYWYTFDVPLSYLLSRYRFMLQHPSTKQPYAAMLEHKSQLLWFRRLYVIFSRYMILNTLQEMSVADMELDQDIGD